MMGTIVQAGAFAGAILAVAAVAALAWKAFIAAVEGAIGSRIDRVVQQQYEQDADFNETLGALTERLSGIESCLRDVRAQVYPNSGSSLRDRVDALYELVLTS
jgi:cell division protein FtsN